MAGRCDFLSTQLKKILPRSVEFQRLLVLSLDSHFVGSESGASVYAAFYHFFIGCRRPA